MDQPVLSPAAGLGTADFRRKLGLRWFWHLTPATGVLIAMNLVMFALTALAGGFKNPDVLLNFGASYGPYLRQGQSWRLIMPMFLHVGWWHLAVNMYALFLLGPILERMYGYGRFALIYVGAGVGGSLLSMLLTANVAVGASGAIFGIAGAMLVAGSLHREALPYPLARLFRRGRFTLMLLVFVVLNLIFGYAVPNIDNFGHLGGLIGGALLALFIAPPEPCESPEPGTGEERPFQTVVVIPVVVVGLAMAAAASHYRALSAASRLVNEGRSLRTAHKIDQAIDRFRAAEKLAPADERPREELGSTYLAEKRYPDAIREYGGLLRLNPKSPEAELGLAVAYRESGNAAKAEQLLSAVLAKNPRSAEIQATLADLYLQQKHYQDAISRYQQALLLDPSLAAVHNNLAWLYATCEDPKFRNPAGALDHARRAVRLTDWKQPEYIDTLAEAFYVNSNYAQAVRVEKKALELTPNSEEYQQHMARYRKAAGV